MPTTPSGKVLVTGANGYVGGWVVKTLLQQGFSVRGTVRSEEKAAQVKELFREFGDQLEMVLVGDITQDGAFDKAVEGVHAVIHVASPVNTTNDPNGLIRPAVRGTETILESALKYGSFVKRVVVTSSTVALYNMETTEPRIYNEDDWNEDAVAEVETKGSEAGVQAKYAVSKIYAERAAWAFMENNRATTNFDLVVINPPIIIGPLLFLPSSIDRLGGSMSFWWQAVKGAMPDEVLVNTGAEWIDVRDAARAHVLALQKEDAGGKRIIVSSSPFKFQDWVNAAHAIEPSLPAGNRSYDPANPNYIARFDTSRAEKIFGIKYTSLEQTTKDMIEQFREKGWLQ